MNKRIVMIENLKEFVMVKEEVKVAKVKPNAILPTKREEDGCYDIYACFDEKEFIIPPLTVKLIPTGIATALPTTLRAGVRERGSNTKGTLIVMAGQIDSGYRGEWFVALYNGNQLPVAISKDVEMVVKTEDKIYVPYSKAIAQFAIEYIPQVSIEEISFEELSNIASERGTGCLGSSNK